MKLTAVIMFCTALAAGDSMQLNLGGIRKIEAVVERADGSYQCKLSFLGVTCFDPATNRRVNLSKSRDYAIRVFGKAVDVTNGAVKVEKLAVVQPLEMKGLRASIVYKAESIVVVAASRLGIPVVGVEATPSEKDATMRNQAAHVVNERTLLSCLDDLRATLRELDAVLAEDIAGIKPGMNLEGAVADLEQKGVEDYKRLKAETEAEKLLLSIEKSSLEAEIQQKMRGFLERLTAAYADLRTQTAQDPNP